ncbi:Npun_F5749 family FMN-dependent PPOX-type flavoprotein [Geitlerinema sp. PCC 9228]|jgi:PPOX class probable FMN-dependent enzyme|uniref:Npun_F5749 family FMN-dependent PPOX-type flavoprotein n=1 Tax=Geitlerinema sp. PCC 9228 TaxID=111611 RepID=UPI0008F99682|nr:Npun_F5749 family FMN-dependent PPOX-type flavoprotein [Geitlerinema sp. PCC 9228]
MTTAPWRSPLSRALHRNRSLVYARYLQLATLDLSGRPANRTVVFRGFLENTNRLKFITDIRSEKITQMQHCSWSEACWYFPKTREQFRLLGTLDLVDAHREEEALQKARYTTWQNISDPARNQFTWPHPGSDRNSTPPEAFENTAPDATKPLDNFCLLLLDPIKVDYLLLRGEPQNRYIYELEETEASLEWQMREVNP